MIETKWVKLHRELIRWERVSCIFIEKYTKEDGIELNFSNIRMNNGCVYNFLPLQETMPYSDIESIQKKVIFSIENEGKMDVFTITKHIVDMMFAGDSKNCPIVSY